MHATKEAPPQRQLFGTDGMRGVAGEFPLDRRTVYAFGEALGEWAASHAPQTGQPPQVLVGMDTRESGPWLAEALAGGLGSKGVTVRFAGLVTTPGVAWLTKTGPFAAGVMISASHNPFQDNGLKVFNHSGYKLPDETEATIEAAIFRALENSVEAAPLPLTVDPGLDHEYSRYLASTFRGRLDGWRIVLDCANGAAVELAPALFRGLGADVVATSVNPDGRNINAGCGALHVEGLQQRVVAEGAACGFAFDGDADRCIAVSHSGKVIDGDAMLLVCARHLRSRGELGHEVVATVMSNLGFEKALERDGIALLRTPVGDKYVLEEMIRRDAEIGGEQSGHVIFHRHATTGDGMLTALRVLEAMVGAGKTLDELTADLTVFPQKLVNVRIGRKKPLSELPAVQAAIAEAERDFSGAGRVLVRFSGTEPLARVMVEGADGGKVQHWVSHLAALLKDELS